MKKSLLLLLGILSTITCGFAQKHTKVHESVKSNDLPKASQGMVYFDGYQYNPITRITEHVTKGVMDTRISDILNESFINPPNLDSIIKANPKDHYGHFTAKEPFVLGVRYQSGKSDFSNYSIKVLSKNYSGRLITDSSSVEVLAMGIDASNVKDYRFRVIENDSTQIGSWQIPQLQQKYGAKKPYAYLGEYKAIGKQMMVEVINIKDYNLRDGIIFSWPTGNKAEVKDVLFTLKRSPDEFLNLKAVKFNRGYATKFDDKTGLPLDFNFPKNSLNQINISFKNKIIFPYDVYWVFYDKDGRRYTPLIGYSQTDNVFTVSDQYLKSTGKNELLIYPTGIRDPKYLTKITFEVTQKKSAIFDSLSQYAPYFYLLLLLFIAYILYNKRKLGRIKRQKEMANLQLNGLRAQLNPHFMFNALTSIQNLVNQNDNKGANHYLTKFAQLTRQVLKATGQELISLEDEVALLSNYLEMEKLRFGFDYSIIVSPEINLANMQIPSMLLQPFIENAAKHGVSAMQEAGKIEVNVSKEANNLVLTVRDNGEGFDDNGANERVGVGLKLSRERIRLLNEIYGNENIELDVKSTSSGVTVTIRLTNWL